MADTPSFADFLDQQNKPAPSATNAAEPPSFDDFLKQSANPNPDVKPLNPEQIKQAQDNAASDAEFAQQPPPIPEGTRRPIGPGARYPRQAAETPPWTPPAAPQLEAMPAAPKPPAGWEDGARALAQRQNPDIAVPPQRQNTGIDAPPSGKLSDSLPLPEAVDRAATDTARTIAEQITRPQPPAPPAELDRQRDALSVTQFGIRDQQGEIERSGAALESARKALGDKPTAQQVNDFNAQVQNYNSQLVALQASIKSHGEQMAAFNKLAQQYNAQLAAFNKSAQPQQQQPASIPGMLPTHPAGQPPPIPGLNAPEGSDAPGYIKDAYEAKYGKPPDTLGTAFREPARQVSTGVERIAGAQSGRDVAGGVSGILRGAVGTISGPENIGPMVAAAPIGGPLTISGSMLAKEGTQKALEKAKVPKEYAELAGDVVQLAVAGGGARYLIGRADAAIAEHNAVAERMLQQEQSAGRVQSHMDDVFAGESHPIKINGQDATIEYVGASTSGEASLKGRPFFRVKDATGKQLTAGTGPEVQAWLAARGAVAAPLAEPPAIVREAPAKPAATGQAVPTFEEFIKGATPNEPQPETQPGAAAPEAQPQGSPAAGQRPTAGAQPGVQPVEPTAIAPGAANGAEPGKPGSTAERPPAGNATGEPNATDETRPQNVTDAIAYTRERLAAGEVVTPSQLQRKFRLGFGAASNAIDEAQKPAPSVAEKPQSAVAETAKTPEVGTETPEQKAHRERLQKFETLGRAIGAGEISVHDAMDLVRKKFAAEWDELKAANAKSWDELQEKFGVPTSKPPAGTIDVQAQPAERPAIAAPVSNDATEPHTQTLKDFRARPDATSVPKGSVLGIDLDKETPESLQARSKNELSALATVLQSGRTSGTKAQIAQRITDIWKIRGEVSKATVESLEQLPGKELRRYLDELDLFKGGNKHSQAVSIINWRNRARSEGQNALTEAKWLQAIHSAVQSGQEIPQHVVEDVKNRPGASWALEPAAAAPAAPEARQGETPAPREITAKTRMKPAEWRQVLDDSIRALQTWVNEHPGEKRRADAPEDIHAHWHNLQRAASEVDFKAWSKIQRTLNINNTSPDLTSAAVLQKFTDAYGKPPAAAKPKKGLDYDEINIGDRIILHNGQTDVTYEVYGKGENIDAYPVGKDGAHKYNPTFITRGDLKKARRAPEPAAAAAKPEAKTARPSAEQVREEVNEHYGLFASQAFWGGLGTVREGDPQPYDVIHMPEGDQHVVTAAWRTATATAPDGQLHVNLMGPDGRNYGASGADIKRLEKQGAKIERGEGLPAADVERYNAIHRQAVETEIRNYEQILASGKAPKGVAGEGKPLNAADRKLYQGQLEHVRRIQAELDAKPEVQPAAAAKPEAKTALVKGRELATVSFGGNLRAFVSTADEASALVSQHIKANGWGASDLPEHFGEIHDPQGKLIARVSYNGRVWDPDGKLLQGAFDEAPDTSDAQIPVPPERQAAPPTPAERAQAVRDKFNRWVVLGATAETPTPPATPAERAQAVRDDVERKRQAKIAENEKRIAEIKARMAAKGEAVEPEKPAGNPTAAKVLRALADGMQKQIDAKLNPAIANQNPTARRARIASGMAEQGQAMQRTQGIMRNLADAHEQGTAPAVLQNVNTRALVEDLDTTREEYPRPFVHQSTIEELEKAGKGKPGSKAAFEALRRGREPNRNGSHLNSQEDIKAVEELLNKTKVAVNSYVKDGIARARRLNKAGITPENWNEARTALRSLEKPQAPADQKQRTIADLERGLIGRKFPGYFPTPQALAARMVEEADIEPGMLVLEPSAGKGNIADEIKKTGATLTTVERVGELRQILELKGHTLADEGDFLEHAADGYDRVVMNPPFEDGQDVAHVRHAFDLLKPGGRLVAIMGEHAFFANDKNSVAFRDWLEEMGGTSERLPEKSFEKSGTGSNARLVIVDKAAAAAQASEPVRDSDGNVQYVAEFEHGWVYGGSASEVQSYGIKHSNRFGKPIQVRPATPEDAIDEYRITYKFKPSSPARQRFEERAQRKEEEKAQRKEEAAAAKKREKAGLPSVADEQAALVEKARGALKDAREVADALEQGKELDQNEVVAAIHGARKGAELLDNAGLLEAGRGPMRFLHSDLTDAADSIEAYLTPKPAAAPAAPVADVAALQARVNDLYAQIKAKANSGARYGSPEWKQNRKEIDQLRAEVGSAASALDKARKAAAAASPQLQAIKPPDPMAERMEDDAKGIPPSVTEFLSEAAPVDLAEVETRVALAEGDLRRARNEYNRLKLLADIVGTSAKLTDAQRAALDAGGFGHMKEADREEAVTKGLILAARNYDSQRRTYDQALAEASKANPMLQFQPQVTIQPVEVPHDEAADSQVKASTDYLHDTLSELLEAERADQEESIADMLPQLMSNLRELESDIKDLPQASTDVIAAALETQKQAQAAIDRMGAPGYAPPLAELPDSPKPEAISKWLNEHTPSALDTRRDQVATYGDHAVYPLKDGRLVWAQNIYGEQPGEIIRQRLVQVSPTDEDLQPDFTSKDYLTGVLAESIEDGDMKPAARDRILKMYDGREQPAAPPPPAAPEPEPEPEAEAPEQAAAAAPAPPQGELEQIAARRPVEPRMVDVEDAKNDGLTKAQAVDLTYEDGYRAYRNLRPHQQGKSVLEVFDPFAWRWLPAGEYSDQTTSSYSYGSGYRRITLPERADEKLIASYPNVRPGPLSQDDLNEATKSFDATAPNVGRDQAIPRAVRSGLQKMDQIFSARPLWKFRQTQINDAHRQLKAWKRAYERSAEWDDLFTQALNTLDAYGSRQGKQDLDTARREDQARQNLADRVPDSTSMAEIKASAEKVRGGEEALTAYKDGWRVVKYHYKGRKPSFTLERFDTKTWDWEADYGARSVDKERAMREFKESSTAEPLKEKDLQEALANIQSSLQAYNVKRLTEAQRKAADRGEKALPDRKPDMSKPFTYEVKGEGIRYYLNFPNGEKWEARSTESNVYGRQPVIDGWDGPRIDEEEAKGTAIAIWWREQLQKFRGPGGAYSRPGYSAEYNAKIQELTNQAVTVLPPSGRPAVIATREEKGFTRQYSVIPSPTSDEHLGYTVHFKDAHGEWSQDNYTGDSAQGNTYDHAIQKWLDNNEKDIAQYNAIDPVAKNIADDLNRTAALKIDMAAHAAKLQADKEAAAAAKRRASVDELPQAIRLTLPNKAAKGMADLLNAVVAKKSTIPILQNVAIVTTKGKTKIYATDLETSITFTQDAAGVPESATTIPLTAIKAALKGKSKDDLKISGDGGAVTLSLGGIEHSAQPLAITSYPDLPPTTEKVATVPAAELAKAIKAVQAAISSEESRFTLNGALLELEPGQATLVATDGHRLALRSFAAPGVKAAHRVLIPRRSLSLIAKALPEGDVILKTDPAEAPAGAKQDTPATSNFISAENKDGSIRILSRRLVGNFPDYTRVVPDEATYEYRATADRKELLGLMQQAVALKQRSNLIALSFRDGQIAGYANADERTAKGKIAATLTRIGEGALGNPRIGMDAQYMADFLNGTDAPRVEMVLREGRQTGANGKENPHAMVLRPAGDARSIAVIMPLRTGVHLDFDDGLPAVDDGGILGTGNPEAGAARLAAPIAAIERQIKGAAKELGKEVKPELVSAARNMVAGYRDIRRWAVPPAIDQHARRFSGELRQNLAEAQRNYDRAVHALRQARRYFAGRPAQENYDFIDRIERGQPQPSPALQAMAAPIRALLDERRKMVQALGTGKLRSFYQDYFPHSWKDPKKAAATFASIFARNPWEGKKAFLKKRSIIYTSDGLAAGLEPISDNPVDLVLAKLREMDVYLAAHKTLEWAKKNKLAIYVTADPNKKAMRPAGWSQIKDPIGTVFGPSIHQISEYPNAGVWKGLQDVANALGLKQQRGFKNLRGAVGRASKGGGIVQTLHGTAEDVLAHEIGHQIDWLAGSGQRFVLDYPDAATVAKIKAARAALAKGSTSTPAERKQARQDLADLHDTIQARKAFAKELRDLADLRSGSKAYRRSREEKMAQLAEMWVGSRELFQRTAPTVFKEWKKFLRQNPKLHALRDIEGDTEVTQIAQPYDVQGLVIKGYYYMPQGAQLVLDNHLSRGLAGRSGLYRMLLGANNILNQFDLGFSAFHGGQSVVTSIASDFALGIEAGLRGKPMTALKHAALGASMVGSPVRSLWQGNRALKEWMENGAGGGDAAMLIEAAVQAGGRAFNSRNYQTGMAERWLDTMRKVVRLYGAGEIGAGTVHLGKAGVLSLPALADISTWPILTWAVPRFKMSAFMDKARFDIARLGPNAAPETVRNVLAQAWDSMDNRFGEMVLDNLFWNRTIKDITHLTVRSVGWVLGDIREYGGGVIDLVRVPGQMAFGKPPAEVNLNKLSFILGSMVAVALLSAVYQRLHTGHGPAEPMDYLFPKNGDTDPDGRPMRSAIYGYAKDIYNFTQHPVYTATAKVAPLVSLIAEMVRNKDFYGEEIRHKDDIWMKQLLDLAKHVPSAAVPLSVKNLQKEIQESGHVTGRGAENFVGVSPAPAAATQGPAERLAHDLLRERSSSQPRTHSEAARARLKQALERALREHKPIPAEVQAARRSGAMDPRDVRAAIKESRENSLVRAFSHLDISEAYKVYRTASASEKRQLRVILQRKAMADIKAAVPAERAAAVRAFREAMREQGVEKHQGGRLSGPADNEHAGDPKDPYDRAAMDITHSRAQSRFTRADIQISNQEHADDQIRAAAKRPGSTIQTPPQLPLQGDDFTNEGFQSNGRIGVGLHGSPSWRDMQNILHHEDIHALLEKNKEPLRTIGGPIGAKVRAAFVRSRGGQDARLELPSYMGAFKPGDLPGITRADRDAWMAKFLPTLKPETRQTFERIMSSHEASQKFGSAR